VKCIQDTRCAVGLSFKRIIMECRHDECGDLPLTIGAEAVGHRNSYVFVVDVIQMPMLFYTSSATSTILANAGRTWTVRTPPIPTP